MKVEPIDLAAELRRIAGELDAAGRQREPSYCASRYDTDLMRDAAAKLDEALRRLSILRSAAETSPSSAGKRGQAWTSVDCKKADREPTQGATI